MAGCTIDEHARDTSLVPLSDEKGALDILTKSVFGLWDTVNNLTRLRPDEARPLPRDDLRLGPRRPDVTGCTRPSATPPPN